MSAVLSKKVSKLLLWITISFFSLFTIFALLLYIPALQNWGVDKVASYASKKTGFEISVNRVKLEFPLDLGIYGVTVLRRNNDISNLVDTIADIKSLTVDIKLLPLIRKKIEIDGLDFRHIKINTEDLISSTRINGYIGRFQMESHGLDLGEESLRINNAHLADTNVDIELCDTIADDSTKTETYWRFFVDRFDIKNTGFRLHLVKDSLRIGAYMTESHLNSGFFDLFKGLYKVDNLNLKGCNINYDKYFETKSDGFDINHLALSDFELNVDSIFYCKSEFNLKLKKAAFNEKCGLCVTDLKTVVSVDSTRINISKLQLRTTESTFYANVSTDIDVFDEKKQGKMSIMIDGAFGKQDIMYFLPEMPVDFVKKWPNYPLTIQCNANGDITKTNISGVLIKLPTAFYIHSGGVISHLNNLDELTADIKLKAKTKNIDFLSALVQSTSVVMPKNLSMVGRVLANKGVYTINTEAIADGGHLNFNGKLNYPLMAYDAKLEANSIALNDYLPTLGFDRFSGSVFVSGIGTDIFSSKTRVKANASITDFGYSGCDFSGINIDAGIQHGIVKLQFNSDNSLLSGSVIMNAAMNASRVKAIASCNMSKIDLKKLRIFDSRVIASMQADIDLSSNFKSDHKLHCSIRDIFIEDSLRSYRPENIIMNVFTQKDSTHAMINSGDFSFYINAKGGYEHLADKGEGFIEEVKKQLDERYIDQLRLREYLPEMKIHFAAGKKNFFTRTLNKFGYFFELAHIDMNSSTLNGINGKIDVDSLILAGIQIDTIRVALESDSLHTDFVGQVKNGLNNPQSVFNALFKGVLYERGLYFGTRVSDGKDRIGLSLGLDAAMESGGLRIRMGSRETPILGYKSFKVNKDNYLFLSDDRRVSANLKLVADDGMGVNVYTNDSTEALQDLTIGLTKFDLSKVLSVIPYMPNISGIMNGDFHAIKMTDEVTVSSAVSIDDFVYEGNPMGNMSTEFVYIPKGDGRHFIDGMVSCNDNEIGTLIGTYNPDNHGMLDAELNLDNAPLTLLNGFIPDRMFSLRGNASGNLKVHGLLSSPDFDGKLFFDSAHLSSAPYGVDLQFAKTPISITKSHLIFDDFHLYASNKSPLALNGYYDFSQLDNMYMDISVRATNYLLIDSKENPRSEAYGKAYVNFYAMMKGSLESLNVRGQLDVLGSTDMTYVLRDSPLTTDNQMDELVKFVNFNDTTTVHTVTRPPLKGLDMNLSMTIDDGAHIVCALNADHSNYVDLIGGGNLRMQYNVVDNLRLTGRYTLTDGEMKYSLPVIPLKTFTIQDGSYIEFFGDPMNPKLNITATEHTKSTVTTDGGNGRSVEFDCGVVITKTLQDMGLQFIIDAPEDMAIHNELQTMSKENRGKLAVTMLTTGMYLSSGNTNAFSMNSALSAFLNSQINSISGSALRTLDLSFGMDNTTLSTGETQTDYSFKFAKRFWNNRLNIVVGGKLSTGADVESQNDTFFDNVTFEYRLSQNSNKYLKLFYERDGYDWLEGNVGKYGGGFMWRRKLQHFRDIFRFKNEKNKISKLNNDSISTK